MLELVEQIGQSNHFLAVLSVTRDDGSVHSSLVNAGVLDHPVSGERVIGVVVRGDARKLQLARTRRHATVALHAGWQWVAVDGPVDIIGPDDAFGGFDAGDLPELLRAVFRGAGGTHDDWDEYDRVMAAEHRTALLMHPERTITNR